MRPCILAVHITLANIRMRVDLTYAPNMQNNVVRANFYLAMRYQDPRLYGTVLTDPALVWQPKFRADVVLPDRDVCFRVVWFEPVRWP